MQFRPLAGLKSMRFLTYLSLLFLFKTDGVLLAQTQDFSPKSITEILQILEEETAWTFNYDPTALSEFTFSGKLTSHTIQDQLTQLLYDTPYDFEESGQTMLIFLSPPQSYQICGYLKDKLSGTPLPLANLVVDNFRQGTQSDEQGFFQMDVKAFKHQKISVSYIGYQSQSVRISDLANDDCSDLWLTIDNELFGEEIIVKDYLLPAITEGKNYSSVQLDFQKLLPRTTIVEQDIFKTAQLLPGITSSDESAVNLTIRGSTPDQNLIIWEGIPLYDAGHLFGMISAINPYVIDEVQVFKGAFAPKYDNRIGGLIDLSLSDSVRQQIHGGFGTTLTEAHTYGSLPLVKDRLSVTFSGRHSINGLYQSPTLTSYTTKVFQETKVEEDQELVSNGERRTEQQINFYDLNGKIVFRPTDNWSIKWSWLKTQNQFNYRSENFEEDLNTTDNVFFQTQAFNFSNDFTLNPAWQIRVGYHRSDFKQDYSFALTNLFEPTPFFNNEVNNRILDQSFTANLTYQASPTWGLSVGYDYNLKSVDLGLAVTALYEEDRQEVDFIEGHFHNTYLGFNFQKEQLNLQVGIRHTFYQELQKNLFSPRLNFQYALAKNFKVKLSGGILQQYISQLKEFGDNALGLNNQVWVINRTLNGDEGNQIAQKIAGGFVFHQKNWLIDVEGYLNKTDGLSTFNPAFDSNAGKALVFSVGNSTSRGVDVLVKKHWQDYRIWFNYSWSKVDYLFPEIVDITFPASNDQRHKLSLVQTLELKNWTVSLTYQYKSGLPFTEALSLEATEENPDNYYIEYGIPNQSRLADYHRLDVGGSYRFTIGQSKLQSEVAFS
ncbi:MAG: carboxypeptidase-like regulatory domain-containing protein, partial [Bacteroidota bacterium]